MPFNSYYRQGWLLCMPSPAARAVQEVSWSSCNAQAKRNNLIFVTISLVTQLEALSATPFWTVTHGVIGHQLLCFTVPCCAVVPQATLSQPTSWRA